MSDHPVRSYLWLPAAILLDVAFTLLWIRVLCISLLLGPKLSDVGMSHVRRRMYLSHDQTTRCHIWSLGRLTNTFDIVHGTSQHLTLQEQQSNAPSVLSQEGIR